MGRAWFRTSDSDVITAVSKHVAGYVTEALAGGGKTVSFAAASGPPSLPAVGSFCRADNDYCQGRRQVATHAYIVCGC